MGLSDGKVGLVTARPAAWARWRHSPASPRMVGMTETRRASTPTWALASPPWLPVRSPRSSYDPDLSPSACGETRRR